MNKEIDISKIVLKTERLTLRAFKQSDLDDLYEYAKVEGVGEAAGWAHHASIDESKDRLAKFINGKHTFAIVINNKVVGSVGVDKYNDEKLTELNDLMGREIGFVLSRAYWGQGIMTEAVKEVISYLFNVEGLDFITCGHFDENDRSRRVQEKCGFKPFKKLIFDTALGEKKSGVLNILYNKNRYNV